jgi:hypothetical protein
MPRSKTDPYKRRSAQALNHCAGAVLDLLDVYEPFAKQHPEMSKDILDAQMCMALAREKILHFIKEAWDLDEESIKVYLG